MTISNITPAPNANLGAFAPFAFDSDKALSFVSMSFGNGQPEEMAWRDGVGVGLYGASTKVGNTYTFRRDGGWPARPSPHVEEQGGGAAPGVPWGAIYQVDLSAQPAIAAITPGASFLVDGKTWQAKAASWSGGSAELVAGQGLRLTLNDNATWYAGNLGNIPRSLYLDFAQLDTYDPDAPVAVQLWWHSVALTYPGNVAAVAALVAAADNGSSITDAETDSGIFHVCDFEDAGGGRRTRVYVRNYGSFAYNYVVGTYDALRDQRYSLINPYLARWIIGNTSAIPSSTPADFVPLHSMVTSTMRVFSPVPSSGNARRSYGLAITMQNNLGAPFGLHSATLGGFQVLQPKAAA